MSRGEAAPGTQPAARGGSVGAASPAQCSTPQRAKKSPQHGRRGGTPRAGRRRNGVRRRGTRNTTPPQRTQPHQPRQVAERARHGLLPHPKMPAWAAQAAGPMSGACSSRALSRSGGGASFHERSLLCSTSTGRAPDTSCRQSPERPAHSLLPHLSLCARRSARLERYFFCTSLGMLFVHLLVAKLQQIVSCPPTPPGGSDRQDLTVSTVPCATVVVARRRCRPARGRRRRRACPRASSSTRVCGASQTKVRLPVSSRFCVRPAPPDPPR